MRRRRLESYVVIVVDADGAAYEYVSFAKSRRVAKKEVRKSANSGVRRWSQSTSGTPQEWPAKTRTSPSGGGSHPRRVRAHPGRDMFLALSLEGCSKTRSQNERGARADARSRYDVGQIANRGRIFVRRRWARPARQRRAYPLDSASPTPSRKEMRRYQFPSSPLYTAETSSGTSHVAPSPVTLSDTGGIGSEKMFSSMFHPGRCRPAPLGQLPDGADVA